MILEAVKIMAISRRIYPEERIKTLHSFLKYEGKELFIEDIPYREIIDRYGTPVFVFSKERIKNNIKIFASAFRKAYRKVKFFYPYKANYLPDIISMIQSEGWGAEVTSSFEYKIAKVIGTSDILLNGFNRKLYSKAISDEKISYIGIDSFEDAEYLNELGMKLNKLVNLGLRVRPKLGKSQKNALVPSGFKLGYDIESGDAERVASAIQKMTGVRIVALNTHIANRQVKPDLHSESLRSLIKLAEKFYHEYGIDIEYINIGGGFESRNLLEQYSSLDYFAQRMSEEFSNARKEYTFILEPGRNIISDSAIVLTEVIARKVNRKQKWIIVDVGINTLIPLESASFGVIPTALDTSYELTNVGDFLAAPMGIVEKSVHLPKRTRIGDFLGIINAGAYTLSMSEQFALLRPAVVVVEGKGVRMIKREENEEAIVRKIGGESW